MVKYFMKRTIASTFVLAMSSILIFISIRILPGDPVLAKYGASAGATPENIEALRVEAGITRPILAQLASWINGLFHGDMGVSYFSGLPVRDLVFERVPATLELTFLIILIACIFSAFFTFIAVRKPGGFGDRIVGYFTSIALSVPTFIVGIVLIIFFTLVFRILPSRGYVPISLNLKQNLTFLILPSVTGAIAAVPYLVKYLRTSILELNNAPFVRTAEGQGVKESRILLRHILPNALVPTLTMLGLIIGYTLGGVLVIEYMFGIPGIGSLAIEAASTRDYALLQGVAILIIFLFILTSLTIDIICGYVDPRLRRKS